MRVLYVDDDPSMTAAAERMFTSEDFQCDTCALGETAVDLARQTRYDIVLLDVMLPDIDGYEVIARLRKAGVRTPVLLQSGLVDRDGDIDGLWLGASDYLLKPFSKRELFERIQAVLSRPADSWPRDPVHVSQSSSPSDRDRRRRHRRFETVQPGRILHNGGTDCLILNMSHGGAALQLIDADADCPGSFDLLLRSGATLRCHVCWRSADKIGVQGEALFPDEVVTEFLTQGESSAPQAVPPDAASDEPERSATVADGPARLPGQPPPTGESAADGPVEAGPDRAARPADHAPAAPQPAPGRRRDEPGRAGPTEAPARHAGPAAVPAPAPKPPVRAEDGPSGDGQVFTVDRGTRLVAEACECDLLVVEGQLEAAARARRLRLGRDGRFFGRAVVETAEIIGHYEGDLTVADRLVIRAGGTVSGTTRYGRIVIEAGGGLVGQVQLLPGGPLDAGRIGADRRADVHGRPAPAAHA